MRRVLFAAALAVVAWAALVVPMPLAAVVPIPAMPVADIVDVGQQADSQVSQELLFTAVRLEQPSAVRSVAVLLDDDRDLTLIQTMVPPGIDEEQFSQMQERLFDESIRKAAAVGLRAAGQEVDVSGDGARVVATVPGTPADGVLQRDDVIVAVDGESTPLASELAALVSSQDPGQEVELTIQRGGQELTETVTLTPLAQTGQTGLGVLASTVNLQIDLPVQVQATEGTRVGGSSAGLMIALAVHDAVTEGDLAGGRTVAGSGAIDLSGNVRPVSAISEKVAGAVESGADVFLVPEVLAEEARSAAPPELEVVPVATFQDALDALAADS